MTCMLQVTSITIALFDKLFIMHIVIWKMLNVAAHFDPLWSLISFAMTSCVGIVTHRWFDIYFFLFYLHWIFSKQSAYASSQNSKINSILPSNEDPPKISYLIQKSRSYLKIVYWTFFVKENLVVFVILSSCRLSTVIANFLTINKQIYELYNENCRLLTPLKEKIQIHFKSMKKVIH